MHRGAIVTKSVDRDWTRPAQKDCAGCKPHRKAGIGRNFVVVGKGKSVRRLLHILHVKDGHNARDNVTLVVP